MIWRRLLILVVVSGAGVSFGQTELTGYEIFNEIRNHTYVTGPWSRFLAQNQGGTFNFEEWEITYPPGMRAILAEKYEDWLQSSGGGCGIYDAGLGVCSRNGPGIILYYGFNSGGHKYGEGYYVGIDGCPTPQGPDDGHFRGQFSNGSVNTVASCKSESYAHYWATLGKESFRDRATGTWLMNQELPRRVALSPSGSFNAWNQYLAQVMERAFTENEPTVDDLVNDWGIIIAGAPYLDGGWGGPPEGEGGGPGGDPTDGAPSDGETNCNILDIPCNLRKLFIPTQDHAASMAALRTSAAERVPFGLFAMTPAHGDGGTGVGLDSGAPCVFTDHPTGGENYRIWFMRTEAGGGQYATIPPMCLDDFDGFVWWHENGRQWLWWIFLALFPVVVVRMVVA